MKKNMGRILQTLVLFLLVTIAMQKEVLAQDPVVWQTVQEAGEGCTLVGAEGTFVTNASAALERINAIRYEACVQGVPDPRNSSRKLTKADYVPIKWSSDLEEIARIRAAEASLTISHTRPNGSGCFSVESSNGVSSYGEVLAWNFSTSMLMGVEQWYGEKTDWVNRDPDAITGHYTEMIDPSNTYVGLGCFLSDFCSYPNTTSGEFSRDQGLTETMAPGIGDCIVVIEIEKAQLSASADLLFFSENVDSLDNLKVGNSLWCVLATRTNFRDAAYVQEISNLVWNSSDPSVATVDSYGNVKITGGGNTTITCNSASGRSASQPLTVKLGTPKISGVSNVEQGVNIKWGKVDGASLYQILYKTDGGKWKRLAETAELNYVHAGAVSGTTYTYTVRCVSRDGKTAVSDYNSKGSSIKYLAQPSVTVSNTETGVTVSWKKVKGASGYYVYRKMTGSWKKIATIKKNGTVKYLDKSAANGKNYLYTVKAYNGKATSGISSGERIVRLSAPVIKSLKNHAKKKMTLTWSRNKKASGYQIRYSLNKKFKTGTKELLVTNNKTVKTVLSNLKKKKLYYVEIRSFKTVNGVTYYSSWVKNNLRITK